MSSRDTATARTSRLTDLLREVALLALLVGVRHAPASLAGAGEGVGRVRRDAGRGRVRAVRANVDRSLAVLGSAVLSGGDHCNDRDMNGSTASTRQRSDRGGLTVQRFGAVVLAKGCTARSMK